MSEPWPAATMVVEEVSEMTTFSHERVPLRHEWLRNRDMWASLAISAMWLAVLFDSVFGPDFVSANTSSTTRIPSGILVALFAVFGTRAVARYAFRRDD
jgi:hypothetical protein